MKGSISLSLFALLIFPASCLGQGSTKPLPNSPSSRYPRAHAGSGLVSRRSCPNRYVSSVILTAPAFRAGLRMANPLAACFRWLERLLPGNTTLPMPADALFQAP